AVMCRGTKRRTPAMDGRCSLTFTVSSSMNEQEMNSAGRRNTTLLTSSILPTPKRTGAARWREQLGTRVTMPTRLRKDHTRSNSHELFAAPRLKRHAYSPGYLRMNRTRMVTGEGV